MVFAFNFIHLHEIHSLFNYYSKISRVEKTYVARAQVIAINNACTIHFPNYLFSLAKKNKSPSIFIVARKNGRATENGIIHEYPQLRVPCFYLSNFQPNRHTTLSFLTRSPLFLIASARKSPKRRPHLVSLLLSTIR